MAGYQVCCALFAGRISARGGQASQALVQQGAPQGLLSMLQQSASQDKVNFCSAMSVTSVQIPPKSLAAQGTICSIACVFQCSSCVQGGANVGSNSKGVRKGVYKCALRGLLSAAQDQDMRAALQKSQGAATVQVRIDSIYHLHNSLLCNKVHAKPISYHHYLLRTFLLQRDQQERFHAAGLFEQDIS